MTRICQDEHSMEQHFFQDDVDLSLLHEILVRNRSEAGNLITILHETQDLYGYLPLSALRYIADKLDMKRSKVYGVATFYTQFRLQPVGKHLILLCQGTACHVNGADRIKTALCDELKIHIGETTDDGMFTLMEAACLGCCSLAPVMMINGQAYGPLTPDGARKVIRSLNTEQEQREGVET